MIAQLAAIAILTGPAGLTNDPTPTFTFTSGSGIECRVDDGAWTACADRYTAQALPDGSHLFELRSGAEKTHRAFTIDTVAPQLTLHALPQGTTATATFSSPEDGVEFACAADDDAPRSCTSPWTAAGLDTGLHVLHVTATDAAGNATGDAVGVQVESDPPQTTLDGPNGATNEHVLHYSIASDPPGAHFECKLDGAAWAACDPSYTTPDLAPGHHTLEARAIDASGTADPTPAIAAVDVQDCEKKVTIGVVEAIADCFVKDGDKLVTDGSVKVNGITFNPLVAGSRFEFDVNKRTIALGQIQLRVGSIVLYVGELKWTVPQGDTVTLAEIDLRTHSLADSPPDDTEGALDLEGDDDANVEGFPLTGRAKLELAKGGKTELTGTIGLPSVFTDAEGNGLTGSVQLEADNEHGLHLSGIQIQAPLVFVGNVEIHNLYANFAGVANNDAKSSCNQSSPGLRWEGGAEKVVLPTPDRLTIEQVGFGLADGRFNYAKGGIDWGAAGKSLGNGLKVQRIAISICAGPPVKVEGRIGLTALDGKLKIPDGGLIFTGDDPWTLRAEAPAATLTADRDYTFKDLFVQYASSGSVDFGGDLSFAVGVKGPVPLGSLDAALQVDAHAAGFIERDRFNADLSATGCFAGTFTVGGGLPLPFDGLCSTVSGVVSSDGIAVCGSLKVGGNDIGAIGAGYHWSGSVQFMAGTCDVGPWRVSKASASAAGPKSVELPGGRGALVAVRGITGPPQVTLHGPHGEIVETPKDPNEALRGHGAVAFANRGLKTTYVVLAHPVAGRWRVTGDGIAEVRTAPVRPQPKVSATLRGHRLAYRFAQVKGQRVTFEEHGRGVSRTIARATRSGRVKFRPADGRGGRRAIVALVEQDGLPRRRITVARFKAPPRSRPAKPRGVTLAGGGSAARGAGTAATAAVARARRGLTITWRAAKRAVRYGVTIELRDGRRLFFLRDADDRVVRIPHGRIASVRVVGLRSDNTHGPAAMTSGGTR
jgi:hypothetical protein